MSVTETLEDTNGFNEKTYEYKWKIQNWGRIQKIKDAVEGQKFIFETGRSSHIQSKWEVGFIVYQDQSGEKNIAIYLKLLEQSGNANELGATINIQLAKNDNGKSSVTMEKKFKVNEMLTTEGIFSFVFNKPRQRLENYLDLDGAVNMTVKLKVLLPVQLVPRRENLASDIFLKKFATLSQNNYASLLNESLSGDLKILCYDGKELVAHKVILKIQCPVFASMFRSQFSENNTGVVNVEDVSGKTMDVLLNYWYTGQLLPAWSDEDTIVEFIYAAGKYQMNEVMEMLDSVLGELDEKGTFGCDMQLFNLAHKLSLKNAEKRLMDRLKKKIANVDCPDEFLALFFQTSTDNDPANDTLMKGVNQK